MPQYRKSPRAAWIPYNEGSYFVTACTKDMVNYFGSIRDGQMFLSEIGRILTDELSAPQEHHRHIRVPLFVVMPNHFHGIIEVSTPEKETNLPGTRTERCVAGFVAAAYCVPPPQRNLPLLSAYIGSLKSYVTRMARQEKPDFGWQTRYHDHLIRSERDLKLIAEYIENNVARWSDDCFHNPKFPD